MHFLQDRKVFLEMRKQTREVGWASLHSQLNLALSLLFRVFGQSQEMWSFSLFALIYEEWASDSCRPNGMHFILKIVWSTSF